MIRPVLYFDLGKHGFAQTTEEADKAVAEAWGEMWKGTGLYIDKLEVGQVVGYSVDVRDGHMHCGLHIEWSNQLIDVGTMNGGS